MVNTRAAGPDRTELEDLRNIVREQREMIEQLRQRAEPRAGRADKEREEREAATQWTRNVATVKEFLKLKPRHFKEEWIPSKLMNGLLKLRRTFDFSDVLMLRRWKLDHTYWLEKPIGGGT